MQYEPVSNVPRMAATAAPGASGLQLIWNAVAGWMSAASQSMVAAAMLAG